MDQNSQTRDANNSTRDSSNLPHNVNTAELAAEIWSRVGLIQSRTKRLVWIDTLASTFSAVVMIVFFTAAMDWWIRPSSTMGRATLLGTMTAFLLGTVVAFIWRRLRRPISRLAVARRLETVFPEFGDRLSSIVALLEHDQKTDRSPDDRRFVEHDLAVPTIRSTLAALERCAPEKRIDWRSAAQSVLFAAAMLIMMLLLFLWQPAGTTIVTQRLFTPTSDAQWPQQHHLVLENLPPKAHAGEILEIFVRDMAGDLPEDVQIVVREKSATQTASLPLQLKGEVAAANLEIGTQDLELRATGGDDDSMPWQLVQVFESPSIESYRIKLHPPDYLNQSTFEVAESEFKVLAGTGMQFTARLSLPVQSAELELKPFGKPTESIQLTTATDGTLLQSDLITLETATDFCVSWIDANGLYGESNLRWQVSVDDDSAPQVALEKPESDREVTLTANITIVARAKDNLGLTSGWIEILHVQQGTSKRLSAKTTPIETNNLDLTWNGNVGELLDTLSGVETAESPPNTQLDSPREGAVMEVTAVAMDSAGQRGQSNVRRLRIISQQSMRQSIARQQSEAMRELMNARTQQEIALEQTQAARTRLGESDTEREAAADRIQAASAAQQATTRMLSEGSESATRQLDEALRKAVENGFDQVKLRQLRDAIESINQNELTTAQSALQQAAEQLVKEKTTQIQQQLSVAEKAQQTSVDQLDQLIQAMRRDDSERFVNDQLSELAASQKRLNEQSSDAVQAVDLKEERRRLAERQRELARSAEKLTDQLKELADTLRQSEEDETNSDSAASESEITNLRGAIQILEEGLPQDPDPQDSGVQSGNPIANTMRAAANELQRGRAGQAENLQRQIEQQLDEARRCRAERPNPHPTSGNKSRKPNRTSPLISNKHFDDRT